MSGCGSQYEAVCKNEFAELHAKLDRLDEAIRGNGRVGVQRRLDRLETAQAARSKLFWLALGAAVTLAATSTWKAIFG